MSEGLQSVATICIEPTGFQPVVIQLITELGTFGTGASFGSAVSDSGVVAGYTYPPVPKAFVYANGTLQDIGQGATSRSCGIRGSLVVGQSSTKQPFVYNMDTGATIYLEPGSAGSPPMPIVSYAYGINAGGQVAGTSTNGGGTSHAMVWTTGSTITTTDLGTLGAGTTSAAYGINDSGLAAGYSTMNAGGDVSHAVVWNVSGSTVTSTDLGTLGGSNSTAYAINNAGQVVGNANTTDGVSHAFQWTSGGGMVNLDTGSALGETGSTAFGINAAGQTVGTMTVSGANRAFLYSAATMIDLNGTIDPALGWTLAYARGINSSGQIAGYGASPGGTTRAFLLTPALAGDADLSGTVDINDLSKVLTNYDKSGMRWADGDFDGNGTVDINDLSNVLTNYDKSVSSSGAGIKLVPEPSTLLLAAAAGVWLALGMVRSTAFRRWFSRCPKAA